MIGPKPERNARVSVTTLVPCEHLDPEAVDVLRRLHGVEAMVEHILQNEPYLRQLVVSARAEAYKYVLDRRLRQIYIPSSIPYDFEVAVVAAASGEMSFQLRMTHRLPEGDAQPGAWILRGGDGLPEED